MPAGKVSEKLFLACVIFGVMTKCLGEPPHVYEGFEFDPTRFHDR